MPKHFAQLLSKHSEWTSVTLQWHWFCTRCASVPISIVLPLLVMLRSANHSAGVCNGDTVVLQSWYFSKGGYDQCAWLNNHSAVWYLFLDWCVYFFSTAVREFHCFERILQWDCVNVLGYKPQPLFNRELRWKPDLKKHMIVSWGSC